MPRKVFVAGEILTAADVNTNLMDQSVMVFDDATDRATAIPTPVEGMVTYLKDANQVQAFTGSAFTAVGGILQVVSTTKTDTFSTTSTSFVDITGFNVAITPTSASSKILVLVSASFGCVNFASGTRITAKLLRDSTAIAGNADDNFFDSDVVVEPNANAPFPHSVSVVDTPATTSAITYKVQLKVSAATTGFLNRNRVTTASMSSSITLMEVAG